MSPEARHEKRVRDFLASVPPRRLARVEAKHAVLSLPAERAIHQQEHLWPPDLLDGVLIVAGPVHRTPLRSQPSYQRRAAE